MSIYDIYLKRQKHNDDQREKRQDRLNALAAAERLGAVVANDRIPTETQQFYKDLSTVLVYLVQNT